MRRVAMVVVRFGERITGGAELLARHVGTRLAGLGDDVTVLTTCAEDYVSWANVLPAGETRVDGLRVLRFPVRAERDLNVWERTMQPFLKGRWGGDDARAMLLAQGPDAPALLDHLSRRGGEYDAVIFFALLYATTALGLPLVADRAVLVPTLHEEHAAATELHARAIRLSRFVVWNTPEERDLAERMYDVRDLPGAVAGAGIHIPSAAPPDGGDRPYLLYAGRIDPDKGCGELFDAFLAWARHDDRADLVLTGRAWMPTPEHPRIRSLGFVEPERLTRLVAAATATVVPSRRESLSMIALESLAAGTPILVPTGSPVLEGHARRSGAGIVYRDGAELGAALSLLLDEPHTRDALGADGRRYVAANFTWERVMSIYDSAVAAAGAGAAARL